MRLQVAWGKIGIGFSLIAILTGAVHAEDNGYTCMQLMYDHGLATSAQVNCGYEYYNSAIIEDADECLALAKQVNQSDDLKDVLKAGLADFQGQYNETDDKQRICDAFANEFDFIVRP